MTYTGTSLLICEFNVQWATFKTKSWIKLKLNIFFGCDVHNMGRRRGTVLFHRSMILCEFRTTLETLGGLQQAFLA